MNTNRTAETHSAKKHLRRTLPAALVLLAICLVFTAPAVAADTYFPTGGDGTEASPYLITSESDLRNLSTLLSTDNTGRENYLSKHYKLTQDIALTGGEWIPIGKSHGFSGVFDGGGHTVSGMSITIVYDEISNYGQDYGLFYSISPESIVKNLNVEGSITLTNNVQYILCVGGIAGENGGRIENCSSNVKITVTSGYSDASIYVGGITGHHNAGGSDTSIWNSSVFGDVTVTSSTSGIVYAGGLTGNSKYGADIYNSYAVGDVTGTATGDAEVYVGGLVGRIDGYGSSLLVCENSYATGNVKGIGNSALYVGGIVGKMKSNNIYLSKCYATGDVEADGSASADTYAGGITGCVEKHVESGYSDTTGYNRIHNSYALNEKITATGGTFNLSRIAGYQEKVTGIIGGKVEFKDNHGWANMMLNGATVTDGTKSNNNGADIKSSSVWNQLFGPFTAENGWEIYTGNSDFQMPVRADVVKPVGAEAVHLKVEKYTVTFYNNPSESTTKSVYEGDLVEKPTDPTWDGHRFNGWFTEKEGLNEYDFSTPVSTNLDLYANWTEIVYHTVDFWDGHALVDTRYVEDGEYAEPPYLFDELDPSAYVQGWYTDNTTWTTPWDFSVPIQTDLTLHAKWGYEGGDIQICTISFNANGGGGTMEEVTVDLETEYVLPECGFTAPAGMTFAGWVVGEEDPRTFQPGDIFYPISEYTEFVAQWMPVKHTVVFVSVNNQPAYKEESVDHGTQVAEPETPVREGYHFVAWENNSVVWNFETDTVTQDLVLVANWTQITYNISFSPNGGTGEMENITVPYDGSVELPDSTFTAPTGYEFAVWCDQADWDTGTAYSVGWSVENVTSDMSFYAQWSPKTYYITFNTDEGTPVKQKAVEYNATISVLDEPTKEGYTFNGWNPALPERMPADNLSVTAQWTAKTYTVTWIYGKNENTTESVTYNSAISEPSLSKEGYTGKCSC